MNTEEKRTAMIKQGRPKMILQKLDCASRSVCCCMGNRKFSDEKFIHVNALGKGVLIRNLSRVRRLMKGLFLSALQSPSEN